MMNQATVLTMLSWFCTITGMLGASLLATEQMLYGYILFLVNSSLATVLILPHDRALGLQFLFFTLCNMLGIFNALT